MDGWDTGLHLWFVRCNLIKMSILPKFLYLFQTLPIKIPTTYFKRVQNLFMQFIWAHKKTRILRSVIPTKTLWRCCTSGYKEILSGSSLGQSSRLE